jgi:transcriptional regulator with XRE-family HTH domain
MILDKKDSIADNVVMAKRQPKKLSDQVRQAIDDSGLTRYRIAVETGMDESALAKFYNGHRGLSLNALDRLGEYLGLRIVMDRKPKKKGR